MKGSLILIGGNVVLLYASKFNDVSIVVNMSGRFNLERGIEGRLGKKFLQRIKETGFIDVWNKRGKQSNVISLMILLLTLIVLSFGGVSSTLSSFSLT